MRTIEFKEFEFPEKIRELFEWRRPHDSNGDVAVELLKTVPHAKLSYDCKTRGWVCEGGYVDAKIRREHAHLEIAVFLVAYQWKTGARPVLVSAFKGLSAF